MVTAVLLIVFTGCKKENFSTDSESQVYSEGLSSEDALFLDTIGVENWTLDSILGYRSKPTLKSTSSSLVQDLHLAMLVKATKLFELKQILYPGLGDYKPAHYGIAYSLGQRNCEERLFPEHGNKLHRSYAVFGIDCSGLMISLLRHQGINIANCQVATFEHALREALRQNNAYKNISIEKIENPPITKIENGDFIMWRSHMGIVSVSPNGNKVVFQSNGTGEPVNLEDQQKNWSLVRGVRPIDLNKAIHGKGYWGTGYKILRFKDEGNPDNSRITKYHLFLYRVGGGIDSFWMDGKYSGRTGEYFLEATIQGENVYNPNTGGYSWPMIEGIPIHFSVSSGSLDVPMVLSASTSSGAANKYYWSNNPGTVTIKATMPDGTEHTRTSTFQ